jgi:hypothetical protein
LWLLSALTHVCAGRPDILQRKLPNVDDVSVAVKPRGIRPVGLADREPVSLHQLAGDRGPRAVARSVAGLVKQHDAGPSEPVEQVAKDQRIKVVERRSAGRPINCGRKNERALALDAGSSAQPCCPIRGTNMTAPRSSSAKLSAAVRVNLTRC